MREGGSHEIIPRGGAPSGRRLSCSRNSGVNYGSRTAAHQAGAADAEGPSTGFAGGPSASKVRRKGERRDWDQYIDFRRPHVPVSAGVAPGSPQMNRMVAVVLPDMPANGPPGDPMKSIR